MKNQILVPTDFSDFSEYAADAAIQIAKRFDAVVHFLNITFLDEDLNTEIREAMRMVENQYSELGIEMKTSFKKGALVEVINDFVQANNIDLIVMGSHGASGFNEMMIGSNTQKVVRHIHCPLLVVKSPIEEVDFQHIVFASDFSNYEKAVFERFLEFIKMFSKPHIHLVAVNTSSFFNQPQFMLQDAMRGFQELAAGVPCTSHIEYHFNVEAGVEHYATSINADLVVMSNYQRSKLRRLFVGSTVEALINHSEIPVLSLDF